MYSLRFISAYAGLEFLDCSDPDLQDDGYLTSSLIYDSTSDESKKVGWKHAFDCIFQLLVGVSVKGFYVL